MFSLLALLIHPALASTPFTSSAKDLAIIFEHPDVWQTYFGPIRKVEVVAEGPAWITYRVTVSETAHQMQPRAVQGDPTGVILARVGSRPVERVFEATVSSAGSDPMKSGRSATLTSVKDVSVDPCVTGLGSSGPE